MRQNSTPRLMPSTPLSASFPTSSSSCSKLRNTDTESDSHSGDKVSSTILSPFASSILKLMARRKRCGSILKLQNCAKRIRVNPPNDGSDILGSTFNENTDILSLNGKESTEKDTKTLSANASPVRKDNSDCDVGRAQCCYMLRSCDAKMEISRPNCEKNLKSKPLSLSKLDNTESQNATCVDNLNQNTVGNSSRDTGDRATSTNLIDKYEGGRILVSTMEVECDQGTYIADDTNKHANDIGNIKQCINKMSAIDENVPITQTKDFPKCRSDYLDTPSGAWIENRDDTNDTIESEKNAGITNNQDENQAGIIQQAKVSKLKIARNQVRVQRPNISEGHPQTVPALPPQYPTPHYLELRKNFWDRRAARTSDPITKTQNWLGTFDTVKQAPTAYDDVEKDLRTLKTKTNHGLDLDPEIRPVNTLDLFIGLPGSGESSDCGKRVESTLFIDLNLPSPLI